MSMRATFTTNFIYDGAVGYRERKAKLCKVLGISTENRGGGVIGQLAGVLSGLDLSETDILRWKDEQIIELSKIIIVPIRIVYLLEGGQLIYEEIQPRKD